MANPAPRPALRKAPDSHINPALPTGTQIDLRNRETASDETACEETTSESIAPDLGITVVTTDEPTKADKRSKKKDRKKIKAKLELSAKARRKLRTSKK